MLRSMCPLPLWVGACFLFLPSALFGQAMSREEVKRESERAAALYKQGKYQDAANLWERILPAAEATHGKNDALTASILTNLGQSYYWMTNYARAEPFYQRSLEANEARLGKDHLTVASSLYGLAYLYYDWGQYTKAAPLFIRSLEIYEARLGKDHPTVANSYHILASVYHDMGQYAKAEPLYQRSQQIWEAKLGKDHPDTASNLNNLAYLYYDMGQYAKAEVFYLRSLQIREAKLGKDHPNVASSLNNIALLYHAMGQYAKAEEYNLRSLQIREARLGKDHPRVAHSLNNLAALYSLQGQYAKAEPLLLRSLQIREAKLGPNHPHLATSLNNLALLYRDTDRLAKAEPLYQRSLRIRETQLGKDHPDVALALNGLAWYAAYQKDWPKAIAQVQKARQATARHLAEVLPVLSEPEQLSLLQAKFEKDMHRALSLGWAAPKEASAASAEWLLNSKAVAHQTMAEQQLLARDAKDPKARRLVEDLQQTRARLAALINRLPKLGMEKEYQQEMQELKANELDLSQKLARAVGRPHRTNPWITLNELRAKLGPQTAFVDIARFDLFDFAANQSKGPRYVAWITPPQGKGDIQLIDLGAAEPIDQLVGKTRKTLLDSAKSVTKVGEVVANDVLQKALKDLSAKVLHPLLPPLEKYQEWIVCPDGALWLTPWNALVLPDGKFTVEKYLLRHVVSGRDLVLELPRTKAGSAFLFADPDYDLSPGKVMAAAGSLRGIGGISLAGQRLHGLIGTWKVSFEFLDNEVLIRDEEDKGTVVGKASWKLQGNTLTMQTRVSRFEGTIQASEIRGQRSQRNDDGTTTVENFRIDHLYGENGEARFGGSAFAILPRVLRLPSTALEAEAVRPKIRQWLGQDPKVFLEEKASEAMLKSIKNPRVLTLATHGYFLPTQEVASKGRPGLELDEGKRSVALLDKKGQPIENPLLRCGLLLAGCNKRNEAQPGEEDGILTGLEIVGMDLNGCELVVLSACETGLGDVRNGEGVAGLRQAFQLAGAKAVLASLWQVPDRETALLMNAFYGELAKGRTPTQALRQAQLQRIASRREQFGAAHPFFWSAFALTSRGTD